MKVWNVGMLRIATRAGLLAEAQTRGVVRALERIHRRSGLRTQTVLVGTSGDRNRRSSLKAFGGTGVFVKELQRALVAGQADCAVHSLKDLPLAEPRELVLAAVLRRADARDALVVRNRRFRSGPKPLPQLPLGATVGTGSPRRRAQLAALRPDLRFVELRGNIGTRIQKVRDGYCDAAVLAVAGLRRAKLTEHVTVYLPLTQMLPAPGQGALAVECRKNDRRTRALLAPLHDARTALCVAAERAALQGLGGGCGSPLGALARYRPKQQRLTLQLALELRQPQCLVRAKASIPVSDRMLKKNPTPVLKEVKRIARNLGRKLAAN